MGVFARIPTIEQTVGTPGGPGPVMGRPPDPNSPIASALESASRTVDDVGQRLAQIAGIQHRHQQIIDSVKTHEQAKTDLTQQQLDIQTNNPPQLWASKFKEFADDYQQKTLADPANAHIKDYLAQQLPQITGLMYRDMLEKGVAGTQALQHQQFELMGKPLSRDAGADYQMGPVLPEHYMQRNAPYAKPGPYQTKLSPSEEVSYQKWAKEKGMVADEAGYDMRGFWKSGGQSGYNATAGAMHQPDTFKTPYSESFSNESKYALPNAPHWEGQYLVDEKGNKIFDDKTSKPIGAQSADFQDGPVAKSARRAYYKAIDLAYPNSPQVANLYKQTWEREVVEQRAQAIAADHPTQMAKFLDTPEAKAQFTGDQRIGYLGKANESSRMGQATIDAQYDKLRSDALNYQDAYTAQNGHPDWGRLSSDAQFEHITKQDFQRRAGYEYELPTPQTMRVALDASINNAPNIDSLQSIKADMESAARNKLMNGADLPVYSDKINKRIEFIKTTAGTADKNVRNAMRDFYSQARSGPQAQADRAWEMRNQGVFRQTMESAIGRYEAMTFSKPNDPQEYWKAMDEVLKAHPRPADPDVTPPDVGALSTVTDSEALRALGIARANRLIPAAGGASGAH